MESILIIDIPILYQHDTSTKSGTNVANLNLYDAIFEKEKIYIKACWHFIKSMVGNGEPTNKEEFEASISFNLKNY